MALYQTGTSISALVGIGTTNPTSNLQAYGTPVASGNVFSVLNTAASGNVAQFSSSTGTALIINANGNVGIGTTSSSYLLDVNGQSRIGNPAHITDASTVLRMTTSGGASYFQTGTALTSGSVGDTVFTGIYATPEFMRIKSTGNVGIGTASPGYLLDVAGSMRLNGNYTYIGGNGGSASATWAFDHIDTGNTFKSILFGYANSGGNAAEIAFNYVSSGSGSNYVNIGFYGSRPLSVTYAGNVGIGLTNPSYTLDVSGTFRCQGSKIIVQNSVNGTSARGIFLWTEADTNWGIYMATCGTGGASLANATTCSGSLFNSHAVRIRCYQGPDNGIVFENASEGLLMSIRANDAYTYHPGAVGFRMLPGYTIDAAGRCYFFQSQQSGYGWNRFTGIEADTIRAQLVLNSSYSDLIMSSSENNGYHGSTLSFVTNSTANNDYRKFVLNINNWGVDASGSGGYGDRLTFGWRDGAYTNPHDVVSTDGGTMTIDGRNRRVGINGQRNPICSLDVTGKGRFYESTGTTAGGSGQGTLVIQHGNNGGSSSIVFPSCINYSGADYGYIQYNDNRTAGGENATFIIGIQNDADDHIALLASGNIGVQRSDPAYALDVSGSIRATSDIIAYSDKRVKTDFEPIENALDKVSSITGYTFRRIDEVDKDKRHAGVIAQEVLEILPEVVHEEKNGHLSVAYGNLAALFIQAIKEERKAREAVTCELHSLEERLSRLEKIMNIQ